MDLNINDELVTKYYDLKEERKKLYDAIIERKVKEASEESLKQGIEQGIQQGIEQGIEKGIEKGIQENKKQIILNMHNKNMNYEDIAELTNLQVFEVKEIINNLVNEKEGA